MKITRPRSLLTFWCPRLLKVTLFTCALMMGNARPLYAQAPVFTSALTMTGTAGSSFSYQITATNSPNSLSLTGLLPSGINFPTGTSSGIISGTPTATGTFSLTLTAGNLAQFANPLGVAVDGSGNIYLADTNKHAIRKISPAGVVSTFAGVAGIPGTANGTGSAARFNYPTGLSVDGNGNIYVADQYNHAIRKITPSGVVSTFAGSPGYSGSNDGPASAARFYYPIGVTVDGSGNVYVADQFNYTIRVISSAGFVSTLAGSPGSSGSANGTGSTARFGCPTGVAVDGSGNVYVADQYNNAIRKVTSSGSVSTFAGSLGVSGTADGTTAARFNYPTALVLDGSGTLFVTDKDNHTIRKILQDGTVSTLAGSPRQSGTANGTGALARFNAPFGIALDGNGNLCVADQYSYTLRNVTPSGVVSTIAGVTGVSGTVDGFGVGSGGTTSATLALTITPVPAPTITSSLGVIGTQGTVFSYQIAASNLPAAYTATGLPVGLSLDPASGLISGSLTTTGTFSISIIADNTPGASSWFYSPNGVAVEGNGNVYVADSSNHVIRKITPSGAVTTLAGFPGSSGTSDGIGSAARFNNPDGVAVDQSGNVYVADSTNNTIRKISPSGVVSTLAGSPGAGGTANGTGSSARFNTPYGVAVDGSGNVYVAEEYNYAIRKITAEGVVTTLAGSPGISGTADGTGSAARFNTPTGVTVDGSGNVYVAEWYNNTVRKITPQGVVTTVAGSPEVTGTANGTGSAARFWYPYGVAVDGNGNLYVSEYVSSTIRKITGQGVVSTLAGTPGVTGTADGTGSAARFDHPVGVAADANGTVYVADQFNQTIRKISPAGVVSTIAGVPKVHGSADTGGGTGAATLVLTILGPVDAWRLQHFGTSSNTGDAADLATPYGDGMANIMKFAFAIDPSQPSSPALLPQPAISGSDLAISFNQPVGISGIVYGAEWSTTLESGSWHPLVDEGSGTAHLFRVPIEAAPKLFMRLLVAPSPAH